MRELFCLATVLAQFLFRAEPVVGFVSFQPSAVFPDVVGAFRDVFVRNWRIGFHHDVRTLPATQTEFHQAAG